MKAAENSRRKSTNNLGSKPEVSDVSARIIGLTFDAPYPKVRKENASKKGVIGAKSIAAADHLKINKMSKEYSRGLRVVVSTKYRVPRFSSETGTRDQFNVVPSLWHKADERTQKTLEKKQRLLSPAKKKSKVDGHQRVDSQTPLINPHKKGEKLISGEQETPKRDPISMKIDKGARLKEQRSNSSVTNTKRSE